MGFPWNMNEHSRNSWSRKLIPHDLMNTERKTGLPACIGRDPPLFSVVPAWGSNGYRKPNQKHRIFSNTMMDKYIDSPIWTRQLIQEVQDLELSVSGSFEVALERDTV